MVLSRLTNALSRLSPKRRRAEKARDELRANAEKALRMKQENDSGSHVPPHRTAHEGMPNQGQSGEAHSRQSDFNTQMGRSAGGRAGDAS
jgi:hypothetical protein